MLWLARTLPWTREVALQEQAKIERMVLEHQLDVASVRDFDVETRDRAGRELVALHRSEHPPEDAISGAFSRLAAAGAHELMVELASAEDSTHDRSLALRTALLLGDWATAGRMARTSAAGDGDFAQKAAVVACILGDRETAIERLAEADQVWREFQDSPVLEVLLIELHCGLPHARNEPRESHVESALNRAASLYQPGATIDSRSYPNRHELAMTVARMAVAQTEPIVWSKDLREADVELIDRIGMNDHERLVPVIARTRDERPGAGGPVVIAELEAGARRMAELAATAPVELELERSGRTIRPRESLIWGGFCLASMAAAERVWRGQIDEARAIHEVARELAATEEFRPFALIGEIPLLGQTSLLDPDEALRVARSIPDEQLAATQPLVQVMLRMQLALVHEQAGELDRAIELITGAVELLPGLPTASLTSMGVDSGARWVYGAMLFRAGREGSLELEAPDDLRGRAPGGPEVFAYWWTAARADPAAQIVHRWRAGGESMLWLAVEPWSLASALELLARSGPADKRELWLDTVSADIIDDPLDLIRARMAAAERLGDAAAIERWREREAALTERLRDDRAAALYRMLE